MSHVTIRPLFPSLPDRLGDNLQWSACVQRAHELLKSTYDHAVHVLLADSANPTQIAFHIDQIKAEAIPLLMDLTPPAANHGEDLNLDDSSDCIQEDELPAAAWLENVTKLLGDTVCMLKSLAKNLDNQYVNLAS